MSDFRIISNLLLKNGQCFQSYGWNMFRPLGKLQTAVDLLEEYHIDEIAILCPIRTRNDNADLRSNLEKLRALRTMTPISFGGGLRTLEDINLIRNLPIERLILSSAFIEMDDKFITEVSDRYGRQAIQAILPFKLDSQGTSIFHSAENRFIPLTKSLLDFCDEFANEVVLYDTQHEGYVDQFDMDIINKIQIDPHKVLVTGGIGRKSILQAKEQKLAAAIVENRILHKEYLVEEWR